MRSLPLDDLPKHSAWARYLLDPTEDPPDDLAAYTSEATYDELYARILADYRTAQTDSERFARRIVETGRDDPGPISAQEDLFLVSPGEVLQLERATVRDALARVDNPPETVVDLGCGWGSALRCLADAFPDATVVGGEYSPRGVELARALHADVECGSVQEFDFTGTWDIVDSTEGETLVFTRGALTTLPELDAIVDRFGMYARDGDVIGGVHLEQVDTHPDTTLGLLRRRYGRVRGYNGELLSALERHPAIEVVATSYDVLGPNPLHPRTMIQWRSR